MFGPANRLAALAFSPCPAARQARACASGRVNIKLAIERNETGDEPGMAEFVLFAFVSLTILVFVLAYWPKTRQIPPASPPARSQATRSAAAARRVALVIGNGAYNKE